MDGRKLRRRLERMTVVVVLTSVLILVGGSFAAHALYHIQREAMSQQMQSEAEEYHSTIRRQIDSDFQTLYTLARYLEFSDRTEEEQFARGLYAANQENDFITMAYYPVHGDGIRAISEQGTERGIRVTDLNSEVQDIVRGAWNGTGGISRIYYDKRLEQDVYVYSVPVYQDGKVVGALSASHNTQIFMDILADATVLNGKGYIHLIGREGSFLVRSGQQIIQESLDSIFDGTYIAPDMQRQIKETIAQEGSGFFSFQYEGQSYQIYLEPVGVNSWYLFCVNTMQGFDGPMYQIFQVTRITFAGGLVLVVGLVFYGYRQVRRYNRDLLHVAYRDTLTGAYNRTRFVQLLKEAVEARRGGCIAILNIRQFKFFNEIFGREQADQLLCRIKRVLDNTLHKEEFFCRDTADSFYLFLEEQNQEAIRARLETIFDQIAQEEWYNKRNYKILLYCGAAIAEETQEEARSADGLMTDVFFALARARESGQDTIWFYDSQLHKKEQMEHYVESHMHQALREGEFKLYLQPKQDLKKQRLGGAEALVRWITEEGRMIYPDQFIPLFEENGFCVQMDLYMVEQVCRQLRVWLDAGLEPVPISVNQSKLLFFDADYIQTMSRLVEEYQIPANLITLEILEGLALERVEELNAKIVQLQKKGFRISMDDFGSGYSSLNTFGSLKIDELKLDRAFLLEASDEGRPRHRIVMEQIVQLTKRLRIATVVEGVETAEHERFIQALGCDFGQGYYYSRPISAAEFNRIYLHQEL